jgi:hypothetical protein
MVTRPTNTAEKSHAPRAWVTKSKNQSNEVAQAGVIQIDLCDMKMRIHDACNYGGGAYVMLISNCPDANGNLPVPAPATLVPEVFVPANTTNASSDIIADHMLGFRPVVQLVLASNGQIVDSSNGYTITHINANSVKVTRPANSPATILVIRS